MQLVTGPVAEPLTLPQVKQHLRIDADVADDDVLVTRLITVARQQAEHRTGRVYGAQTWRIAMDAFPAWAIRVPLPPLIAITSIEYDDAAGAVQTLPGADCIVRPHGEPGVILPVKTWPATYAAPGAVRITMTCGVTDTSPYWASLQAWMLLAIGVWYQQREGAGAVQTYALPHGFWDGLLDPLVFYGVTTP